MVSCNNIDPVLLKPIPIRVHTGRQRRGRKLSDCARMRLNAALRDITESRSDGRLLSVRDAAELHKVPKSTLHRYLRISALQESETRPNKLGIEFILSETVDINFEPPPGFFRCDTSDA